MWAQGERPEVLPYNDNEPIPPGYKVEERARTGLIIAGSIVFGLFYLGSVAIGMDSINSSRAPYGALFVPVIGPFIVAGAGNPGSGFPFPSTGPLYVFDGFVQAGGAAMLLAGIFAKKKVLARQDVALTMRPEFSVGLGSVGMKLTF